MLNVGFSIVLMLVAFAVTTLCYPYVLSFARRHNIVDNPDARKLQRVPVPVMGGTTVFIGFLVSVALCYCVAPQPRMLIAVLLLAVLYLVGVWDDVRDVSPTLRFLVELLVVWMMILLLKLEINDFHGLWGIGKIPDTVSVPLSLIAGVGIINAVNMIDGVDGYCSTFGIMACAVFAVVFYHAGDMAMFAFALITIGALIPFFFHNVFGKTSKMFLGDGGSLLLGAILVLFVFSVLSSNSMCAEAYRGSGFSLPALTLAVLAIPVFDTLKVMAIRIVKGYSPFRPDKTHLHHLFIEMDFTHLATSGIIVLTNAAIVEVLFLVWWLGAGIDLQTYIVIVLGLLATWGFYFFMEWHHRQNDGEGSALFKRWYNGGKIASFTSSRVWQFLRGVVDSRFLGGRAPAAGAGTPAVSPVVPPERPDPRIE